MLNVRSFHNLFRKLLIISYHCPLKTVGRLQISITNGIFPKAAARTVDPACSNWACPRTAKWDNIILIHPVIPALICRSNAHCGLTVVDGSEN